MNIDVEAYRFVNREVCEPDGSRTFGMLMLYSFATYSDAQSYCRMYGGLSDDFDSFAYLHGPLMCTGVGRFLYRTLPNGETIGF